MSIPEAIAKLSTEKVFTYLLLSLAVIFPGIGYIILTKNQLFLDIQISKLILLGIFYSLPLLVEGILFASLDEPKHDKKIKSNDDYYRIVLNKISLFVLVVFSLSLFGFYNWQRPYAENDLMNYTYFIGAMLNGIWLVKKIYKNLCPTRNTK